MNIIIYKCLNSFHRSYINSDTSPELAKLSAFVTMMQNDYSGENLISKIISTDFHWDNMLNTKGFGRGTKYEKAQDYKKKLIKVWNNIIDTFSSKNEAEISKLMGQLLWDIAENEFTHSYLGLIEIVIKQNKLWKNPLASEIFCSYYSFIKGISKTPEEIANERKIDTERVRQLKEQFLNSFNQDFWFVKDELIKEKLGKLFTIDNLNIEQLSRQTEIVNTTENVHFSQEFYTYLLSLAFDLKLVGSINDIKSTHQHSSKGNIWKNLYLQTQEEKERCDLESLINFIAIQMYDCKYYLKKDMEIPLTPYATTKLSDNEIENYNAIIRRELVGCDIELSSESATIRRNSNITQPEMVETALQELDGFAYADDILKKVIQLYPEKDWTMLNLRGCFNRGSNFYSVGKSGLFGLINVRDFRNEMGDGTLNDIMYIYMSRNDSPVHIYQLLEHINNLFPRPKPLNTLHTILGQNSKQYFIKYEGGFYGLTEKSYINNEFKRVVWVHSVYLSQIINERNGISFKDVLIALQEQYGLLEIQVKYLLYQMTESQKISLTNGLYHRYSIPDTSKIDDNDNSGISTEEISVEIDEEELSFYELDQPDIPNELVKDAIAQIKVRRGQPRFRFRLLKLYNNSCLVTGCKIPELLEAAHIFPHSMQKNYSLSNGLLLRADIHTLFDLGMIAINPESMRLELSSTLMSSSDYAIFNNIDIASRILELDPNYKISDEGLKWRWRTFVESNN